MTRELINCLKRLTALREQRNHLNKAQLENDIEIEYAEKFLQKNLALSVSDVRHFGEFLTSILKDDEWVELERDDFHEYRKWKDGPTCG